jgi:uncharacterized protein (TIGR00369 family)
MAGTILLATRRGRRLGPYCGAMAADEVSARSRSFTWEDPLPPLAASRELDGLSYIRAMIAGDYPQPPIASLMNFWLVSAEPGKAVFECEPGEYHYNPLGMIHGGLACTLLDSVVGCAGHTTLPAGVGYTSIDLNVSYLRPILATSGLLRATGRVVKGGQRVIFASGELTDAAGTVLATATSSLLVLRP